MMIRFKVNTLSIIAFAIFLAASLGQAEVAKMPNILIVIADDLNKDSVGVYGNKDVKTPNIDRLASQGMRFNLAYTSTAMCAPTRQQMYTGLYPVRSGAYPNHSKVKPGTKSLVHYLKALGYRVGLSGKRHFGPPSSFPFEQVSRKVDAKAIREFVARDEKQPFCLLVTSNSPHVPWSAGDASQYDPGKLTIPPYWVDTPEMRESLTRYYAEITDLDREVGECMKILRETKQEDNTAMIFTTEQGAQYPGCKWTCYENGLNVGFIVRWPGQVKPGSVSDAMIHYVDVAPTLVEMAGGEAIKGLDGRTFLGVLRGKTKRHNSATYGVHTQMNAIGSPPTGYAVRSIRAGKWKYIMNLNHKVTFKNALTQNDKENYWASWVRTAKTDPKAARLVKRYLNRPAEQLYDLSKDPHELNNLAGREKQAKVKARLKQQLQDWMTSQGDLGQATEMAAKRNKKQ
jgi:uncharacterized sulfatase